MVWKSNPFYTLIVAILALFQGFLPAIQLWISKLLVDSIAKVLLAPKNDQWFTEVAPPLLSLVCIQAGLLLVNSIITTAQGTVYAILGDGLINHISLRILRKVNSLDLSLFENADFYDQMQNAYQQATSRPLGILSNLFSLIQTTITLLSVIYLLFKLQWAILPLIIITTLPMLLVQSRYGQESYWMARQRAPELRKQSYIGTILTSDRYIKEVRVFQLEDYFLHAYQALYEKFFSENRKLTIRRGFAVITAYFGSITGWLISAIYIIVQAIQHNITVGDFALYTQSISITQGQLQSLLNEISSLYSDSLFMRNLFEFLNMPARDISKGKRWEEPIREIEFKNVTFSYPNTDRAIINDLSFKIGPGKSLALVGRNGAGKTTLIKLLCQLYKPSSGEILINGKNIAEYSPQAVQEKIAVLFQDFAAYFLTVRENIGVGKISEIENSLKIKRAACRGGANALIDGLPNQYDTILGKWFDNGVNLSGGEWQKIALSRAFMRESDVLILDEPTASLDAEAEFETFKELLQDKDERITLLISHRFSTVRMADHILVIEDGKCIESGSHEELMSLDGCYAHLFKLQAQGYEYIASGTG